MSNLIPEQRPDKNGNVVTRWVRRALKQNQSSRSIPKVIIGSSDLGRKEASDICNRLLLENARTEGEDTSLHRSNRDVVLRYMDSHDYGMIQLFDQLGTSHPYESIANAAAILKMNNHGDKIELLSDSQMHAYRDFQECLSLALKEATKRKDYSDIHLQSSHLSIHVLLHPEDGPFMENAVSRGVFARTQVLEIIEDMREKQMSPAISDGFL